MATYFGFMNYFAFIALYIVCFYFIFQPYSEIISIYILFVIHTAFTAFIGIDISNIFLNENTKSLQLGVITIISLLSLLICNTFHFVSLILIILMTYNLQKKLDISSGTPIKLPNKYKYQFNKFLYNCITVFVTSIIILLMLFFKFELINVHLKPLFDNSTYDNFKKRIPSILILGLSIITIVISTKQIYIANNLSKLNNRYLL
jgi:hypothetical protein